MAEHLEDEYLTKKSRSVVRRTFHNLIVQNHIVLTVFTLKVLVYFVYFQFCVSDHSAKIVIFSRTQNVDISK